MHFIGEDEEIAGSTVEEVAEEESSLVVTEEMGDEISGILGGVTSGVLSEAIVDAVLDVVIAKESIESSVGELVGEEARVELDIFFGSAQNQSTVYNIIIQHKHTIKNISDFFSPCWEGVDRVSAMSDWKKLFSL